MSSPIVSVIIAFLNPGSWLSEAVDSVCAQTYTNWEIILVDDGSEAADVITAEAYAKRFPGKIFYCMHDGHVNKGLTASRNLGIKKSRGELVAFLDADDYWLPVKLERQVTLLGEISSVQMICEASIFWYSWNNHQQEDFVQPIGTSAGVYQPKELIKLLYPFGDGQPPCPSGIIIRREALTRNKGFEESFSGMYQLYEDQAFLFKIYHNEIVYISDQANNLYRKRANSMSSAAADEKVYTIVRKFFATWAEQYISRMPGNHPDVERMLAGFRKSL